MVTNFPNSIASHEGIRTRVDEAHADDFGGRVLDWLYRTYCGLHGHDPMLHFGQDRIALRCVSCGHETPGWELKGIRPNVTARGDVRRHAPGPQLVSSRRVA